MSKTTTKGEGLIVGFARNRTVYINNDQLVPERSQNLRNHSPDGFAWGYGGSGPAQLALAIALELTNEKNALKMYQALKFKFIAPLKIDKDFELEISKIKAFLGE